ncbi:MAG: LytR/AlgR family response regulator transcription factor [Cytophagaceae bacterium]
MNDTLIRVIIIDDEPLGRDLLRTFLKGHSSVEILAECADGFQGLKAIQELKPDLIFLDIQMPRITGFEMLELIEEPPFIIFTTAYDEYAIKAFELQAIDYLLKPFSRERFGRALEKAEEKIRQKSNSPAQVRDLLSHALYPEGKMERIVIKTGSKVKVIPVQTVLYLEAQDDYVMVYTAEGKFLKQQTMKYFETALDSSQFIRIHRSYLANIQEISMIEPYEKESYRLVLKNNARLPISKSGYSRLKKALNF